MRDVTDYVGADVSMETLIALNKRCESLGFVLYALAAPGDLWHINKITASPARELDTLSGINPGAPGSFDTFDTHHSFMKGNADMANVSALAETPWLKGEDLKGNTVTVTIAGAAVEDMKNQDGTREKKVVVSFVGKQKKMICNRTQLQSFINVGGEDTDFWSGKQVMLAPSISTNGKPTITVLPIPSAEPAGESPF